MKLAQELLVGGKTLHSIKEIKGETFKNFVAFSYKESNLINSVNKCAKY